MKYAQQFKEQTQNIVNQQTKQLNTILQNVDNQEDSQMQAKAQYQDYELACHQAAYMKTQTLEHLDKYLVEFEKKFTQQGGKIIWVENAEQAKTAILNILNDEEVKQVLGADSVIADELDLYENLRQQGIHLQRSSIGNYILQAQRTKRYHMANPALHLSSESIKSQMEFQQNTSNAQTIQDISTKLRHLYHPLEACIHEADFLVAEAGAVAFSENEGDVSLSAAFAKIQIVLSGIERVIPKLSDLELFWSLLASNRSGQQITTYNQVFVGGKRPEEQDGPELTYLILVDNGRSDLLAKATHRQALNCIRCGACENVCPVFQVVGESPYQNNYAGPIGAAITPQVKGLGEFQHLSQASTLCGSCAAVCPVQIDIPQLLLQNRLQVVNEGKTSRQDKNKVAWWHYLMSRSGRLRLLVNRFRYLILGKFAKTGARQSSPKLAKQSFAKQWQKKQKQ